MRVLATEYHEDKPVNSCDQSIALRVPTESSAIEAVLLQFVFFFFFFFFLHFISFLGVVSFLRWCYVPGEARVVEGCGDEDDVKEGRGRLQVGIEEAHPQGRVAAAQRQHQPDDHRPRQVPGMGRGCYGKGKWKERK